MMQVWVCDDTRSYITFVQFLCNFRRVQVILHELEATKGQFSSTRAKGKSCYDFCHRATILSSFEDLMLRKKSCYDGSSSCYDVDGAPE